MSRLHKITNFPLIKKYYITFLLLITYGCYKNGIAPFIHGYNTFFQMLLVFLFPILSFGIGYLFDYIFKNNEIFNSKFYSLLFVMIIPTNTNIFLFLIFLCILLFVYNILLVKKIDHSINFIVLGKLVLILLLFIFQKYTYENNLEASGLFQYSFIDSILGQNISGLFTSNIVFIFIAMFLLGIDEYYKKEIPLYSYGIYVITLILYAIIKQDMAFLLINMFSSSILFALVFIAPLSCYSPYDKRKKFIYSLLIGLLTLPLSLITNFYEGIYISIIFVNILMIGLNYIAENKNVLKINKILEQK